MLTLAVGLVAVACILGREFKIDKPWVQELYPWRIPNSRGEAVSSFWDILKVYDTRSGKLLWWAKTPGYFEYLVGDHYLVRLLDQKVESVDIDEAATVPDEPGESCFRPVEFQLRTLEISDFKVAVHVRPQLTSLPESNRFLIHSPDESRKFARVYACEVDSQGVRLVDQWQCDIGGLFVTPRGQINTVLPDRSAIEVRWSTDFKITGTIPFAAGIAASEIDSHNDLLSYADPVTTMPRVLRVDDFSPIPELDLPLCLSPSIPAQTGSDRRYHILSDRALAVSKRLVVYDSIARRSVYDAPADGFKAVKIEDGKLTLSTLKFGLTESVYDLISGRLIETRRPFLWIIVSMAGVLLGGLIWLVSWIARVPVPARLIPLNILLISMLFMWPLIWRTGREGFAAFQGHPTIDFSHMVVLANFFCLAIFAALGSGRMLLRLVPLLISISMLWYAIIHFVQINLEDFGSRGHQQVSFRIWITFTVFAFGALYAMRYLGWRLAKLPSLQSHSSLQTNQADAKRTAEQPNVYLIDCFILTASVALAIKVAGPQVDLLLQDEMKEFVLGRSLLLVGMAMLGLVALVPSPRVFRAATILAVVVAVLGIADIVLHVSLEIYKNKAWYRLANEVRYPVFLSLAAFACCSIMRRAGIRWVAISRALVPLVGILVKVRHRGFA